MLILDFLRSVSKILSLGAIPSFAVSRKKWKKIDDEDEDADTEHNTSKDNLTEENELIVPEDRAATRGTVFITLRNVSPYTLWLARSSLFWIFRMLNYFQGCASPRQEAAGTNVRKHAAKSALYSLAFVSIRSQCICKL